MASSFVKKTIELDVDLVKRVREIFDVSTDKEAVNRALQLVASEEGLIEIHDELSGAIDLADIYR